MKLRHIEKIRLLLLILMSLVLINFVIAVTTNGTGKTFDFAVTSGKNNNPSSSNFVTFLVVGDITATTNSSNFETELGFIRTAHYLNGEVCQISLECAGGFCCSNVCQSTACPTEEAEAAPSAAGTGGGGGLGAGFAIGDIFSIDTDLIRILIKQGDTYKTKFTIKNTGTEDLSFDIDASALKDILLLSDTQFFLAPNEVKEIDVTIFASEGKKPDIYSGNIKIKANGIIKSLSIIIEVQAKKPLFDIAVQVLPQHKNVLKAENVVANITLINKGDIQLVDVKLFYAIRDIEGNELTLGFETLAIYDQVFRLKELELPANVSFGTYLFYAKISYGIEAASAADVFYIVSEKPATCFDGIQNQNEKGIDCGGPCNACKLKFLYISKLIFLFIFFGIILIVFLIIVYIVLRKKSEEDDKEITKLHVVIYSALRRGHKAEHIKTMLLSRGLPKKVVEKAVDKVVSFKLRILSSSKPRQVKTIQLSQKLNKEVTDYINKALNLGHQPHQVEKLFIKVGWPKNQIKKHISEVLRSRSAYKK